jgi:hypothetical protein
LRQNELAIMAELVRLKASVEKAQSFLGVKPKKRKYDRNKNKNRATKPQKAP